MTKLVDIIEKDVEKIDRQDLETFLIVGKKLASLIDYKIDNKYANSEISIEQDGTIRVRDDSGNENHDYVRSVDTYSLDDFIKWLNT